MPQVWILQLGYNERQDLIQRVLSTIHFKLTVEGPHQPVFLYRDVITVLRIYDIGEREVIFKFDDVLNESPLYGHQNPPENFDPDFDDYVNQILDEVEDELANDNFDNDSGYGSSEE